jgi:hypothetical protein
MKGILKALFLLVGFSAVAQSEGMDDFCGIKNTAFIPFFTIPWACM